MGTSGSRRRPSSSSLAAPAGSAARRWFSRSTTTCLGSPKGPTRLETSGQCQSVSTATLTRSWIWAERRRHNHALREEPPLRRADLRDDQRAEEGRHVTALKAEAVSPGPVFGNAP